MSARNPPSAQYLCDTLPEPQNLAIDRRSLSPAINSLHISSDNSSSTFDIPTREELMSSSSPLSPEPESVHDSSNLHHSDGTPEHSTATSGRDRKLCVRHLRMADEGTLMNLQKSLDALPLADRQAVNTIWSTFSSSSHPRRTTILQGLLTMCCFSQLSFLTEQLNLLIRLDPFSVLPKEVALKVLGYLDAFSLCRAAQVSKSWSILANDDVLWHNICEQHIGHMCRKCGWGLPILEKRRRMPRANLTTTTPPHLSRTPTPTRTSISPKRELEPCVPDVPRPAKRQKSQSSASSSSATYSDPTTAEFTLSSAQIPSLPTPPTPLTVTRPWKSVYCERLTLERNWRRGRCTVRTLKGHTDGVMCMQFNENLPHPSFPVLITGSYDRTARVWNLDTGKEMAVLRGHGRAVRALQFDEAKLITGSMDRTLKVWNWRTGACIRTLEGHTEGIVCLNFDSNVLASGSVDTTIKIWNFRTGECFTLRGHHDWVNSLQLWDSLQTPGYQDSSVSPLDIPIDGASATSLPDIDPGKMLFSASDDGTIKLWDLAERSCIRTFTGHVGQVQSIQLLTVDCDAAESVADADTVDHSSSTSRDPRSTSPTGFPGFAPASVSIPSVIPSDHPGFDSSSFTPPPGFDPYAYQKDHQATPSEGSFSHEENERSIAKVKKTGPISILVSGSLDNTIKVWDIETGKATSTMFGHVEGVWAVAADRLRIVSGSHDRTIKIWSRESGRCTATLVGHRAAVTCLAMGDDKIVSGSDDGNIRISSFCA